MNERNTNIPKYLSINLSNPACVLFVVLAPKESSGSFLTVAATLSSYFSFLFTKFLRVNMVCGLQGSFLASIVAFFAMSSCYSEARVENVYKVKSKVFLSPKLVLERGSVANKIFHDIDFPRGHVALKDFRAEVVDEAGNSVPLQDIYLHHWIVVRYYQRQGVDVSQHDSDAGFRQPSVIVMSNAGVCHDGLLQYFGLGSETRKTATQIPFPYGIEIGNPEEIPDGYEEKWFLNVHAIDTRGVVERLGCSECQCDLYNVTVDEYGRALNPDYRGGLYCCYDGTRCRVREGFGSASRSIHMKYTLKWIDWDKSIRPLHIYILDVTDTWKILDESTGLGTKHNCHIEYNVDRCATDLVDMDCIDSRQISLSLPTGGDVIYGVAHQHTGGTGSTLYGEDGRVICSSTPTYGEGTEAGNEAGYIVGMSTCYPQPGSVRISDGETLSLVSNYSSAQRHVGVMGLFYILVAEDPLRKSKPSLHNAVRMQGEKLVSTSKSNWAKGLIGVGIALSVIVAGYRGCLSPRDAGFQRVVI
ncbi:uncharacterized protein LOC141684002 isoform X2 [Apium graveolens]|uniref:uncharacterized protein LOC141684002 isoform X2 n=1 Tax=Apium graveolens TaxID=4045 RepID=UPI003D7B6226